LGAGRAFVCEAGRRREAGGEGGSDVQDPLQGGAAGRAGGWSAGCRLAGVGGAGAGVVAERGGAADGGVGGGQRVRGGFAGRCLFGREGWGGGAARGGGGLGGGGDRGAGGGGAGHAVGEGGRAPAGAGGTAAFFCPRDRGAVPLHPPPQGAERVRERAQPVH